MCEGLGAAEDDPGSAGGATAARFDPTAVRDEDLLPVTDLQPLEVQCKFCTEDK